MSGFITEDGASYLLGLLAKAETAVDHYYLALSKSIPAPYMIATDLEEPDADEYARCVITNDGTAFDIAGDTIANHFTLTFPEATSDWGSYLGWALLDDPDVGQGRVLFGGDLGTAFEIVDGLQAVLNPGQIALSIQVTDWALEI